MTAKELIAVAEDHAKCGSIRSALVNLIKAVAKLEDQAATPARAATPNATSHVADLPEGLPPLPEGAVYLGVGGKFKAPGCFKGYWYEKFSKEWVFDDCISCPPLHYAAPADSEVARLNGLGVEPAANVEGKWSKAIRIDALEQQINALTKERDEARDIAADLDTQLKVKDARIANLERERRKWQSKYEKLRAAVMAFNNVIHMTNAERGEVSNG